MADLIFHGQFIHATDLDGETGLTVTIDVYRTTIADGSTSQVVTDGSCTETGGGIYRYRYASADLSLYHYVANMKTASADVAQKHVACIGLVVPDALVSSRLAPTDAGRTLDIAATGEASANVTYSAGVALSGRLAEATDVTGAAGSGAVSHTITVNDGANPIDGVEVWITSDEAGANVVAGTLSTDALGQVTFLLDAGSYYAWMQVAGYNFTNPTAITVA